MLGRHEFETAVEIEQLYRIEKQARDEKPDKGETQASCIRRFRQQHSVSILNALKVWLDDIAPKVLPDSKIGEAVSYTLNQWEYLTRYTEDGRMPIDNNLLERDIVLAVQRHRGRSQGERSRLQPHADMPSLRHRALGLSAPRPQRTAAARNRCRHHRPAALQLRQSRRGLIKSDRRYANADLSESGKKRLPPMAPF